jgi:hypothetical protein
LVSAIYPKGSGKKSKSRWWIKGFCWRAI